METRPLEAQRVRPGGFDAFEEYADCMRNRRAIEESLGPLRRNFGRIPSIVLLVAPLLFLSAGSAGADADVFAASHSRCGSSAAAWCLAITGRVRNSSFASRRLEDAILLRQMLAGGFLLASDPP